MVTGDTDPVAPGSHDHTTHAPIEAADHAQSAHLASRLRRVCRLTLVALLYVLAGLPGLSRIADPDIWWHLRTGQWIVNHGSVPTTDPFSSHGSDSAWVAYSWLFDLLVYGLHAAIGLQGIALYSVVVSIGIVLALHRLVRRYGLPFTLEFSLMAACVVSLLPTLGPRPWLLTMLFFVIEVHLLVKARRALTTRGLFWLPLVFMLWANIHIQFVYGLLLLALAIVEPTLGYLLFGTRIDDQQKTFQRSLALVAVFCVLATLLTPYHVGLYRTVLDLVGQAGPFSMVAELRAPEFRSVSEWLVLGMTLCAAFALGWQRTPRVFAGLLLVGAFLAFRARRDSWFVVTGATAIIGDWLAQTPVRSGQRHGWTRSQVLGVGAAVVMGLVIAGRRTATDESLKAAVTGAFPVEAAAFVERQGYTGRLFNHFDWGGYLIWRLPGLPVSMDGRTNVYGDEKLTRNLSAWAGAPDWASNPELARASIVIGHANAPLTALLRHDPRFELVHQDPVATVFVARTGSRE